MKSINFINGIPLSERERLRRWLYISIFGVLCTFAFIFIVQIHQLQHYCLIYKDYCVVQEKEKAYKALVEKNTQLTAELQKLKGQLECTDCRQNATKKVLAHCKLLPTICSSVCLQSYTESENKVQFMVIAPSIENVSELLQQLNKESAFGFLSLVSMQPKDKSFLFTIMGNC